MTSTCRSLVDYRTRKAHRYVIRDRDLLKYLAGLVVFVTGYLAAWSALTAHLATEGHSPLALGRTNEGLAFTVCKSMWWEYVTEAGTLGRRGSEEVKKRSRDKCSEFRGALDSYSVSQVYFPIVDNM